MFSCFIFLSIYTALQGGNICGGTVATFIPFYTFPINYMEKSAEMNRRC
jgi:hypothetical protein